ncbi:hypothetical protein B0H11DRAFT_2419537 [Mycena galericulata]|nr:hypothetical protein B0H11DRAFT_2419537 [Mycena galericulata]
MADLKVWLFLLRIHRTSTPTSILNGNNPHCNELGNISGSVSSLTAGGASHFVLAPKRLVVHSAATSVMSSSVAVVKSILMSSARRVSGDAYDVILSQRILLRHRAALSPCPTDFDTISGIIRLSKKYEVEALLKRALVHLASAFPTAPAAEYPGSSSWKLDDQEIRVVLFARELALEWILPVAFYCVCAKGSIEDILEGVYLANARVDLNPLDKRECLRQHTLLRTSASAEMVDFLWDPSKIDGCRNQQCTATRIAKRKEVEGWRANNLPLTLWIEGDWVGFNVCDTCMSKMKIAHPTALDKFWEGLPQRFGLPAWDELKETRKNALGN